MVRRDVNKLNRIIKLAEQLLVSARTNSQPPRSNGKRSRVRRTGKELIQFRKMLKTERRKGIPVAALARKHGVSPAYIYLLP